MSGAFTANERVAIFSMVAGVWIAAIVALIAAFWFVAGALSAAANQHAAQEAALAKAGVVFSSVKVAPEDYKELMAKLRAGFRGVEINASTQSISINAKSVDNYMEWRAAVSAVMVHRADLQWSAKRLCTGSCGGNFFSAEMTATKNTVATVATGG